MQLKSRCLLTTIDLAKLTAAQGSTIFGADAGDISGGSVSSAGDANGDDFFKGYWYATCYFCPTYAGGKDYDTNKFIRFLS